MCHTHHSQEKKAKKEANKKRSSDFRFDNTLVFWETVEKDGTRYFFTKINNSDAAKHRASDFFPKMPKQSKPLIGGIETGKIKEE